MEDSRVCELIKEALAEEGAIRQAMQSSMVSSLGELGAVSVHVQAALSTFLAGPIKEAIEKAKAEIDFDMRGDAAYPFRKVIRAATATQLAAAWQAMMVDPDHIQSLSEGIHESGFATILALHATHPENPELERLKQHVALKNAPRQKWKKLCLPAFGGGSDRLQVFLLERVESSQDNLIKALSRSVLALYLLLERRYTVSQNVKKNGVQKSESQRSELMPLVYESIKAFKRRTTKSTASGPIDNEVLLRDFGLDVMLGQSKLLINSSGAGIKRGTELSDGRPHKLPKQPVPPIGSEPSQQ